MGTWKTGKQSKVPAFLKDYVVYPAALDEAHNRGLRSIETQLLQIPNEANGNVAIVKARVDMLETANGEDFGTPRHFEAHGDASPENVGNNIVPHIIRMAETRAKGRALRDAINEGRDIELEDNNTPPDIRPGWNSATNSPPKQSVPAWVTTQTERTFTPEDPPDNIVQIRNARDAKEFVEQHKPKNPGESGGGATEEELDGLIVLIESYQDLAGQELDLSAWEDRNMGGKSIDTLSSDEVKQFEFILGSMIEYAGGKADE